MADLVIERCLPSAHEAQIQSLFLRGGRPEFGVVYERAYKAREPHGLRSWIGRIAEDVVLHISVAPEQFSDGQRTLTAGLLGDLMADEQQRDFWSPVKLVRRMASDVKKDRAADFLLTSYVPAAETIFRATGFKKSIALKRHVMPLIPGYGLLRRWLHREREPVLTSRPSDDVNTGAALRGLSSPGCFRPVPRADYYATRMPRIDYPAGTWLFAGSADAPDAALLVTSHSPGGLTIVDALWRASAPRLAGTLSAVARWARRKGYKRLTLTTTEGSVLSLAARRAGFFVRQGDFHLMLLALSPPDTLPPFEQWCITPFVLTGW